MLPVDNEEDVGVLGEHRVLFAKVYQIEPDEMKGNMHRSIYIDTIPTDIAPSVDFLFCR